MKSEADADCPQGVRIVPRARSSGCNVTNWVGRNRLPQGALFGVQRDQLGWPKRIAPRARSSGYTPPLTFRDGAILEVGLQKFYFEFRDAVERWELYKVSLQFFCIKCAEVIIIYIKSVIFSSFVSVSRHSQRRKKKE